jgi:hypothetical protein
MYLDFYAFVFVVRILPTICGKETMILIQSLKVGQYINILIKLST